MNKLLLLFLLIAYNSHALDGSQVVKFIPGPSEDGVAYTSEVKWAIYKCPGSFRVEVAELQNYHWDYIQIEGVKYYPSDPLTKGLKLKGFPIGSLRGDLYNGSRRLGSFNYKHVQNLFANGCFISDGAKEAEDLFRSVYATQESRKEALGRVSIRNLRITSSTYDVKILRYDLEKRIRKLKEERLKEERLKEERLKEERLKEERLKEERLKEERLKEEQEGWRALNEGGSQGVEYGQYYPDTKQNVKSEATAIDQHPRYINDYSSNAVDEAEIIYKEAVAKFRHHPDGELYATLGTVIALIPTAYPQGGAEAEGRNNGEVFENDYYSGIWGALSLSGIAAWYFIGTNMHTSFDFGKGSFVMDNDYFQIAEGNSGKFSGMSFGTTAYRGARSGLLLGIGFDIMSLDEYDEIEYFVKNKTDDKKYLLKTDGYFSFKTSIGYWKQLNSDWILSAGIQPVSIKFFDEHSLTQIFGFRYRELKPLDESSTESLSWYEYLGPIKVEAIFSFLKMSVLYDPKSKEKFYNAGFVVKHF